MDVDIDKAGLKFKKQCHHGMPVSRHGIHVGGSYRTGDLLVPDRASIDIGKLMRRRGPVIGRNTCKSGQQNAFAYGIDLQGIVGEFLADDIADSLERWDEIIFSSRVGQRLPVGPGKFKPDVRERYRYAAHNIIDGGCFRPSPFMNFSRAGVLKNRSRTSTCVP